MSDPFCLPQAAWYVVHTKPKQEFRALEQLQNQGYVCFLPTLQIEKLVRGKKYTLTEPLFNRYLFIRLEVSVSNWSPIRSTRGVVGLLKFGERFASLPDGCVQTLQQAPIIVEQRLFEPGDRVAVAAGPFAGLEGIYQAADGEARALILIEMMSKPQNLVFAMAMLRKAA